MRQLAPLMDEGTPWGGETEPYMLGYKGNNSHEPRVLTVCRGLPYALATRSVSRGNRVEEIESGSSRSGKRKDQP